MTLHPGGTRLRLFPELFSGYAEPETVLLSPAPGTVRPGPADDRFYVANAVDKRHPYLPPRYLPPHGGPEHAAARPDQHGHFDDIPVDTPQFLAAHLYGVARHTMDIWEHYLGHPVQWWHAPAIPRLELVPVVHWPNAHSGPGFLETGTILNRSRHEHRFCLNFDVIAHEIGHAVIFAIVGAPAPGKMSSQYLAFHECFADLFGLIGVLRFSSVIDRLLMQTQGNLHALNAIGRLGRYSDSEQIRDASNDATMAQLQGVALRPDGNWDDPTGRHRCQDALSAPLTGAIFDMFVEIFQDGLVSRGVVAGDMDARGRRHADIANALPELHRHFERSLQRAPGAYYDALLEARDVVGFGMAHAMHTLHPDTLSFGRVAGRLLEAASNFGEQPNIPSILQHFLNRGINPLPFLEESAGSLRFVEADLVPRCRDPAAYLIAREVIRHPHRET